MCNDFGKLTKKLREAKNLNARQFISLLKLKVSSTYITKIEKNGEIPSRKFIIEMARVLGVTPHKLLEQAKKQKLDKVTKDINKKFKNDVI